MSLRKSPTLTPALVASNRRNAKQSTGPRTARDKAWSRLNSLRHGWRSPEYIGFRKALLEAPPGQVGLPARAFLPSKGIHHPLFLEAAEVGAQTETAMYAENRSSRARGK